MKLALLLHIIVEAAIGLLFLCYGGAADLVPGFANGEGESYHMLLHMYGVAALFMAAVGLVVLIRVNEQTSSMTTTLIGLLCLFHAGMAIVQMMENPDTRAALLHFVLLLVLGSVFTRLKVPQEGV